MVQKSCQNDYKIILKSCKFRDNIIPNTFKNRIINKSKTRKNHVKVIYQSFNDQEISDKIATLLKHENINAEVKIIFQTVDNLHIACPGHTGDWYFTGDYPTAGGRRVVNQAFINFIDRNKERAY